MDSVSSHALPWFKQVSHRAAQPLEPALSLPGDPASSALTAGQRPRASPAPPAKPELHNQRQTEAQRARACFAGQVSSPPVTRPGRRKGRLCNGAGALPAIPPRRRGLPLPRHQRASLPGLRLQPPRLVVSHLTKGATRLGREEAYRIPARRRHGSACICWGGSL